MRGTTVAFPKNCSKPCLLIKTSCISTWVRVICHFLIIDSIFKSADCPDFRVLSKLVYSWEHLLRFPITYIHLMFQCRHHDIQHIWTIVICPELEVKETVTWIKISFIFHPSSQYFFPVASIGNKSKSVFLLNTAPSQKFSTSFCFNLFFCNGQQLHNLSIQLLFVLVVLHTVCDQLLVQSMLSGSYKAQSSNWESLLFVCIKKTRKHLLWL